MIELKDGMGFSVDFIEYDLPEWWGVRLKFTDKHKTIKTPTVYVPKWDETPSEENILKMLRILFGPDRAMTYMDIPAKLRGYLSDEGFNLLMGYDTEDDELTQQKVADMFG